MNKVEELREYFNNAYGLEKEWPKTFEVSAELYGRVCQTVFDWHIRNLLCVMIPGRGYNIARVAVGQNGGIMFKNVELLIKKEKE